MSKLKGLKQNQSELQKAEIAAWLHNWRKCSDEHIKVSASTPPSGAQNLPKTWLQVKLGTTITITCLNESIVLLDLVERGRKGDPEETGIPRLTAYLRRCHRASHIEKEETDDLGKQPDTDTRMSSPFGYEGKPLSGLTQLLENLPWDDVLDRGRFLPQLQEAFKQALGETRRPENEVTLWDWSLIVAALYKAALAGALLDYKSKPNDLRWRLLSVHFDGLGFLSEAHRIPDLLGRKQALQNALDAVQNLLEVEYPLGTEVYRDENGSIFVVPGCEKGDCTLNLLRLQDDNGKSLEALLEKKFLDALAGEIVPRIELDEEPWWGQDPGWKSKQSQGILQFNDEYPPVAEHLKPVESGADPQRLWQDWQNQRAEVCTVCGLRPQSPKIRDRHICEVCNERRARRVRGWLEDLSTTVWINEVADDNARVALIVGRFDLTHWLDGTLVRTLRVTDPASPTPPKYVTEKIPSFVRLHRILNTTRRFWQELCPTDPEVNMKESVVGRSVQPRRPRLEIQGAFSPAHPATSLERYQAYELVLERGIALSVVWDEDGRRFITCDNLDYLESERQLGWSIKEILQGATVRIEQPVGYGAQNRLIGDFVVSKVDELAPEYLPVIPLLAEPQTFMALVPADRAIEVVKGIKAKYEQEMGKVRNRLPLHLGVVFAHRRTPLRAILDAGRRMLKQHAPAKGWEIVCAARKSIEKQDPLPERFQKEGKDHFKEWLEVTLKKEDRQLVWNVPLLMGDGQTRDNWYPYIFLDQTVEPTGRRRAFQALNPWTDQKQWLVHVEDLKPGDTVFFTPATFDWVWLDSNARRFEIAYDGQVQRRSSHQKQRPYLLDELETLESIWQTLESHLHRAQIHMLRETIEAKRAAWGFPYDETFRRFCRDLLAEAEWRRGTSRAPKARRNKLPWEVDSREKGQWLERWADYAARGWLSDAVELYGEILKARGGEGEEEREPVRAEVKGR